MFKSRSHYYVFRCRQSKLRSQVTLKHGNTQNGLKSTNRKAYQKIFVRPLVPQFRLKIRRAKTQGPSPGSATDFWMSNHAFYNPGQNSLDISMCFVISRNTTIISNGNKVAPPVQSFFKVVWSKSSRVHFWCYHKQNWNRGGGGNNFSFCDGKLFGQDECKK